MTAPAQVAAQPLRVALYEADGGWWVRWAESVVRSNRDDLMIVWDACHPTHGRIRITPGDPLPEGTDLLVCRGIRR